MNHYEHTQRSIDKLIPYATNARTHSKEQVASLAASIIEFGFTSPVLIDEDGGIIAGHGRTMAAKKAGMTEVPCIILAGLSEKQKKAYVLADNKLAMNAGWDEDVLKAEIESLMEDDFNVDVLGFDKKELNSMLDEPDEPEPEMEFTEEIGENNDYVVLVFRTELEWVEAQEHFGVKHESGKGRDGRSWGGGIGRVVDGGKYLRKIKNEDSNS